VARAANMFITPSFSPDEPMTSMLARPSFLRMFTVADVRAVFRSNCAEAGLLRRAGRPFTIPT